jgi:myo-inositol-1(or 4)-monophosphatase
VKQELAFLETLARQAGAILRAGVNQPFQIDRKGVIDLVTEMDHRSESFILGAIQEQFPTHRIVSEEVGVVEGDASHVWYVDPLDGTVNYAHGIPLYTVSIAYAEDGHVRLGAVYDPSRDELYTGMRGSGARLNGQPIRVSAAQDLDQGLLVTGFPYDIRTHPQKNLDHFVNFSLRSQGVRRLGSAALDLCYLAAGRLDGFWEIRIKSDDIAAGGLIAEEAGARVAKVDGSPDYITPPCSILAATPAIYPQMLALLNQAVPDRLP